MTSPPTSPKPRKGFRGFLRERYDNFKAHLRPPSQQFLNIPGSRSNSKSPAPRESLNSTSTAGETSFPAIQAEETLHQTNPLSVLAVDSSSHGFPATKHVAARSATASSTKDSFNTMSAIITTPEPTPTLSVLTRNPTWTGLGSALRTLHDAARLFPPLQSAIEGLISCIDTWELAVKNRESYEDLARELTALTKSLTQHMGESGSFRMTSCIANVSQWVLGYFSTWVASNGMNRSIEKEAQSLRVKQGHSVGSRLVGTISDEENLIKHYRKIESLFRQLQTDVNLSTWSIANEQLANTRLEALAPSKSALHDSALSAEISRRTCTEGTRTAILLGLNDWSCDPNAKDIYLMSGMAGTGKTTIACSLSEKLEERKQLAASFFCTRTSPECRQVQRIIPTIAYQLARYSIPFQVALCNILGNDPDIGLKNIGKQFERLLKEPLMAVKEAIPDNLVVVIDALDECEDRSGVERLLDLLFQFAGNIPVRFFVTSRPEPEIYMKMVLPAPGSRTILHLHEIEKSLVQADIALYLNEELGRFMSPSKEQIEQLSQRSANLFIYAATLVRHVRLGVPLGDHEKRLNSLLATTPRSTKQYAQLDGLYETVLKSALNKRDLDGEEIDVMRSVLRTVICAQEPVDIETLTSLVGLDDVQQARSAIQPLRSVLHISENSQLISTLHASFPDFLLNQERSGPFFCDMAIQCQTLVGQCFNIMRDQLRFNICDLPSSFLPDQDVHDLPDRVNKFISPPLSYACRYWAEHLRLCKSSEELFPMLDEFLSIRLLFWMEVLNLKRVMSIGMEALLKVKNWLQELGASSEVIRLAEDARNLVTTFTANPISQSTPHIYTSLLAFSPKSNTVSELHRSRTRGLIEAQGNGMNRRDAAALAIWKAESPIRMFAHSPDGARIMFGCENGTFGIRSAHDGTMIIGPIEAHDGDVWDVAFSPCGTRLATCSQDCTIRLWDARNGLPLADPIEGHSNPVLSVAFAPDGTRIASGSEDHTIRVWSAYSGIALTSPFEGHTDGVNSVAFSPEGTRIASGSDDFTVRVWNSIDGTPIAGPFTGHTRLVRSVAFSPDGTRIVSGSYDRSVRVWTADSGTLVAGPFEGHTDWVMSVAFSPDNKRIVSASKDGAIRLWDAHDAAPLAGLFDGHTDWVNAVAFSLDGMHIISCSSDCTIRVWSTLAAASTAIRPEGHTHWVLSVALSPDGTQIVSGSYDRTIQLWDAQTGVPIGDLLHGHTEAVRSATFSPDGTLIASGSDDHTVRIWSLQDKAPVAEPFNGHTNWVISVAFSPDGTRLISGSFDKTVRIWSIPDGNPVGDPLCGHTGSVTCVAFSPDGTRIISGSHDYTIRVWNNIDGAPAADPFEGHSSGIMTVSFSPNGALVASGSEDHTIRLWNSHDGTLTTAPLQGHTADVFVVAFSHDGTRVISGSADRTIRLWNSNDGTLIGGPFEGHTDAICSAAFSLDDTFAISGSADCTIRVWDTRPVSPMGHTSEEASESSYNPLILQSTLTNPFGHWLIREDGWVTDNADHLLFWLPPEALRSLITPHCSFIIGRFGSIKVDLSDALLGNRWRECHISP
ncbi:hypothetical protein CTheo_5518 [Ceratobasidium theobromae]|uniref:NACHT domain-containing protein n=1 Tax=Ceratobasidium theobromae TaxID=1582974 RepID=A0A5N5QH22_9AGAM|nr:hypothetical protein CTheo_5518 [Ceratobasidium theobromae]